MRRTLTLLVILVALALPAPARASCASDAGPSGSDVVFLGTASERRGGYTRFDVAEVWAGPDLAPSVWVQTGQDQPPWPMSWFVAVGSSVDIDPPEGKRLLVGADGAFRTNACVVTDDRARIEAQRPEGVRRPVAGGAEGADPPPNPLVQGGIAAGALLAVVGGGIALWRRLR